MDQVYLIFDFLMTSVTQKEKYCNLIRGEAQRLGFDFCGFAKAEFLEKEAPLLEKWLNQGMHGEMDYMGRFFDKRVDPTKLVPGAKSLIVLGYNYFIKDQQPKNTTYKISKYAYGRDYHKVIRKKLKQLLNFIWEAIGEVHGRGFVDSAPVLEKAWAEKSGIGWIGKNANILNRQQGSFFFLAELILDIELLYDEPVKDYCGTCTKCIDHCPTQAIQPYVVDGSKCISYLTIELKEAIPEKFKGSYKNWVFGCDICQDVCPWNRFSKPHNDPEFLPREPITNFKDHEWEEITQDIFDKYFNGTALKRTKYEGLKRNIDFLKKKN